MADWLKEMLELRDNVHGSMREMGVRYRELVDSRGAEPKLGLHVFLDEERRGIGRGHALRTEFNEETKKIIRQLLRTHDLEVTSKNLDWLKQIKKDLLEVTMPARDRIGRIQEADQELVECVYFVDYYPVVFFGQPAPETPLDPDALGVHPVVFLNGLLDVISELTKSVNDYLLEMPHEKFNKDLIFRLKGRCIGTCEGLWRFLDEYEYVYGGVIDLGRYFSQKYKTKVRRQGDGIRRMRESLLEFRERQLK